jgi:hypothetical protein
MNYRRRDHEVPADQGERSGVKELHVCQLNRGNQKTGRIAEAIFAQQYPPIIFSLLRMAFWMRWTGSASPASLAT